MLEIDIWQGFTKEQKTKQGSAILLSLEQKARQAAQNTAPALIKAKMV